MNKYLFILVFVGTALISACSSDDLMTGISPEEEGTLVVEAGKDSDVPITFGSIGGNRIAMTRTPIELDENDLFITPNGKYLGVFCLATGKQEGAPSFIGDVVWNDPYKIANWKENVSAKVTNNGTTSEVTFLDPDALSTLSTETPKEWYYPLGNWYHYNFYAYYPRITDVGAIHVGSNSIVVDFEIDGKQDIIWGKTTPPHSQAYCAKYLHDNPTEIPQFGFEHKLAKLEVYVKGNINVEVTSATISGVYKNLTLCVASKTTSGENPTGNLTIKEGSTSDVLSFSKVDAGVDVDPFAEGAIAVTAAEKYIGYAMIPPTALLSENEKYTVILGISGDPLPKSVVLENSDESRMVFEEGKSYKITLNIN